MDLPYRLIHQEQFYTKEFTPSLFLLLYREVFAILKSQVHGGKDTLPPMSFYFL